MECTTKHKSVKRSTKGCIRSGINTRAVNQNPKDQLCIVHFPHCGDEYPFRAYSRSIKTSDVSYDVYWNCTEHHYRRLIKISSGAYIDRNRKYREVADKELCVWTEWESITHAEKIAPSSNPLDATFMHQPKYPVSVAVAEKNPSKYYGKGSSNDAINTDPCIFGDTFKYAICRQEHDPWLRKLAENSLILFWAHKGDSFCLDTVFVVGKDSVDYITGSTSKIKCSQEYRNLTLDRLGSGAGATFYRGISYDNRNPQRIYSFAPARILRDSTAYARRCEFDAKDIEQLNAVIGDKEPFVKINGHFRSKHACVSSDRIKKFWAKLTDIVIGKGFVLGVHFDWPKKA